MYQKSRNVLFWRRYDLYGWQSYNVQWEELTEALKQLQAVNIHTALETNGTSPYLSEIQKHVKYLIMNSKPYDKVNFLNFTGFRIDLLRRNYEYLCGIGRQLHIRIPLINHINSKSPDGFAGTRNDANIRGSICNVSIDNLAPSDLTAGVLHGMIEELHGMYLSMGEKRTGIVGSGNGVRKNKTLIHVAEQAFDGKLRIPLYTEEAACGAALFALVACGAYRQVSEVQRLIKYAEE